MSFSRAPPDTYHKEFRRTTEKVLVLYKEFKNHLLITKNPLDIILF